MGLIKGNVLAKQAALFYTGPDRTQILTGDGRVDIAGGLEGETLVVAWARQHMSCLPPTQSVRQRFRVFFAKAAGPRFSKALHSVI